MSNRTYLVISHDFTSVQGEKLFRRLPAVVIKKYECEIGGGDSSAEPLRLLTVTPTSDQQSATFEFLPLQSDVAKNAFEKAATNALISMALQQMSKPAKAPELHFGETVH